MVQNKAIILIGGQEYGKTGTIDNWCKLKGQVRKARGLTFFVIKINGKDEFIVISSSSIQEQTSYNLEKIKKKILSRIERYPKKAKKQGFERFIWIMAFTIGATSTSIKTEQVTMPIDLLKGNGFGVLKVYIDRMDSKDEDGKKVKQFEEINRFATQISDERIKSNQEYERQAKELDDIITKYV